MNVGRKVAGSNRIDGTLTETWVTLSFSDIPATSILSARVWVPSEGDMINTLGELLLRSMTSGTVTMLESGMIETFRGACNHAKHFRREE